MTLDYYQLFQEQLILVNIVSVMAKHKLNKKLLRMTTKLCNWLEMMIQTELIMDS
jgi:hypothetical protein